MSEPANIEHAIRDNAMGPSEASVDGQTVKQHSLRDQIEADRYVSAKRAVKQKLGIRMTRVVPPGAS